jgi:hypothetical protein
MSPKGLLALSTRSNSITAVGGKIVKEVVIELL